MLCCLLLSVPPPIITSSLQDMVTKYQKRKNRTWGTWSDFFFTPLEMMQHSTVFEHTREVDSGERKPSFSMGLASVQLVYHFWLSYCRKELIFKGWIPLDKKEKILGKHLAFWANFVVLWYISQIPVIFFYFKTSDFGVRPSESKSDSLVLDPHMFTNSNRKKCLMEEAEIK